ncbi:MAG: membrane protein insertion efficiency factor YidD [Thermodesulfobacteriota bacterium]
MAERAALRLAVFLIKAYGKIVSPLLGRRCRFYPSCSQYAVEALEIHGIGAGAKMAAGRIARCHPLNPGGYDPVRRAAR